MMTQQQHEPISVLTSGTPKGTDLIPGVDTTDFTQALTGTTKKYVRSDEFNFFMTGLGIYSYEACLCSSQSNLNAVYTNGPSGASPGVGATLTGTGGYSVLIVDGVTVPLNARVLVFNQTSSAQNGIYQLSIVGDGLTVNWQLTRTTDFNQPANIIQYGVVLVNSGNISAGLTYQDISASPTSGNPVGTAAINFSRFIINSSSSLTGTSLTLNGGTPLDTYINGTWTPVPHDLTVVGTPTYIGTYIKIGALVTCTISINSTTSTSSVAGTTSFSGLPYPSVSNGNGAYFNATNTISLGNGIVTANSNPVIWPPSWTTLESVTGQFSYIASTN